jgi:hypothetical protein
MHDYLGRPQGVMKRAAATLTLALLVLGCGLLPDSSVQLLTYIPQGGEGCYLNEVNGLLVVDANYGTALIENGARPGASPNPLRVAWPTGYTAQRVGSEVEVLDPHGNVVMTTGQRVTLIGGYGGVGGVPAWEECGAP